MIGIAEAIKTVRADYWQRVSRWLVMKLPKDSQEIVIGGGTAYYFHKELRDFMAQNYQETKVYWSADLEKDVQTVFNLDPNKDSICVRLADAYGVFRFMQQQLFPKRSPILSRR